jgi:ferrous iron transport protein B
VSAPPFATFALVGNPNCGKTALFNALTGGRQKVANYAGVTVERKEGLADLPDGRRVRLVDLPGTYSLRARSPDEAVTRDAVLGRLKDEPAPDVILCVADATNLALVLRLALELKSTGRPLVFVLNMIDIAERQGVAIDFEALSSGLGVPVTATVATRKRGLDALLALAAAQADAPPAPTDARWREPSASEVREAHRRARDLMRSAVKPPSRPDTLTGRLDAWLLHPVAGVAVLLGLLFLMFQGVFTWAAPAQDMIEAGFSALGGLATAVLPAGWIQGLVVDGLIAGVGSVLVFLPQIVLLFLFILLLEDTGYMARAAFLMDRIMGGAGLHGRAFIPLLSSFACAVPGVMSTRVIDSWRDRLTTILTAPLMTCSARIPVYTLIISALIPDRKVGGFLSLQGLVMFALYAAGILSALVVAFLVRKVFWRGGAEPFMMQLPDYKRPEPGNVLRNLGQKAGAFISRAGRIILPLMVLVWALSSWPAPPPDASGPAIAYSAAGRLGHWLEPLFAPIGFSWEMVVALIPGMAAREVAVAALGAIYAVGGEEGALAGILARQWSLASGLAFLAWYVFAPQCVATLAVVKRETGGWLWPSVMFGYMLALAYAAAFLVFHGASALGLG